MTRQNAASFIKAISIPMQPRRKCPGYPQVKKAYRTLPIQQRRVSGTCFGEQGLFPDIEHRLATKVPRRRQRRGWGRVVRGQSKGENAQL